MIVDELIERLTEMPGYRDVRITRTGVAEDVVTVEDYGTYVELAAR